MSTELSFAIDTAIDSFQLSMQQRSPLAPVTAVFGPSGAGKTTLLEVLGGFRRAGGLVKFGDHIWEDPHTWCPPWQRDVGTVFQQTALFPHLNVVENLAYAEQRAKSDRGLHRDSLVELTGITHLLSRPTNSLSGGERRRVAIARSLAAQPRLLLLDEPMAGLDVAAREQLLAVIRALALSTGVPTIMVSHEIDDIVACADEVWCIDQGQLVDSGRLGERYPALGHWVPAAKVGSLLSASVQHGSAGEQPKFRIGDQIIHVPSAKLDTDQRQCRIRVLARDVAISRQPVAGISIRNQLQGRVTELSEHKDAVLLKVDISGQVLLASVTEDAKRDLELATDSTVWVLIKSVALEPHSGQAL